MDSVGASSTQSQQTANDCQDGQTGTDCEAYAGSSSSISYSRVDVTTADSLVEFAGQANNTSGTVGTIGAPSGATTRFTAADLTTTGATKQLEGYNADLIQSSTGDSESASSSLSASHPWGEAVFWFVPASTGQLVFGTDPATPTFPAVTLNGQAQTIDASDPMNDFDVDDTMGTGSGWNVTVEGASGSGLSPVFEEYCPGGACGTQGYVSGGQTLPADSLTLNTTGASWSTQSGSGGTTPSFSCNSGCPMDASSPTTVATASSGGGEGPWMASGFGASSVSLSLPTTVRTLPSNDEYMVDLVWTLNSGP